MQNVGIPFENCSTKSWNSAQMRQQNSPTTKQIHHKFKLEETKNNVLKKNWFAKTYNLNVFWTTPIKN
jgi:hypothetical protein